MHGWAIWLTGIPGSGKSTLARIVVRGLRERHIHAQILSIEMVREVLTPRPDYSEKERDMVYGTLVFVAKLLTRNGVNVIIDATANRRKHREAARRRIRRFAEIYLKCPLEVCMKRERKRKRTFGAPTNIYLKARTGASKTVPGLGAPYEEPLSAELVLDTALSRPNKCAEEIIRMILAKLG